MKKLITAMSVLFITQFCFAQSVLLDSAKNELYRINKIFDSTQYIGFDLGISYKSDSANVTMQTEQMDGNYLLNKKNVYYHMGENMYVQTDSFAYNIYPEQEEMIMTKNFLPSNSNLFPLKNFVDSMVLYYGNDYIVTIDTILVDSFDYVKRIRFNKTIQTPTPTPTQTQIPTPSTPTGNIPPPTSNGMEYNYFYIDYRYSIEGNYNPIKFEFSYDEEAQSITLDTLGNNINPNIYIATKTVTMNFSNYRTNYDEAIFSDETYVFYNRQRKMYQPTAKYKMYHFITSGFDNEDNDADADDYGEVQAK